MKGVMRAESHVAALGPGWPRVFSRVLALLPIPYIVAALRHGPRWHILLPVLLVGLAFETNRYRAPPVLRLLAVIIEIGGLIGLVLVTFLMAGYAESGRRGYEIVLVGAALAALLTIGVVAVVGATRTLRNRNRTKA